MRRDVARYSVLTGTLLLIGACAVSPARREGTGQAVTPSAAAVDQADTARCGAAFPVFPTYLLPTDPLDVEGTPGPGPDSSPAEPGQLVSHWERGGGMVMEIRWPGSPVPAGQTTSSLPGGPYPAEIRPVYPATSDRVIVVVQVGEDAADPCSVLTVEAYGARPEPMYDEVYGFFVGLRPLAEKAAFVEDLLMRFTRADSAGGPEGRCADPISAEIDMLGLPSTRAAQELGRRFLADRLAGAAAEPCLTRSGLQAFGRAGGDDGLPPPCLAACPEASLTGGSVLFADAGWVELLVEYRLADGELLRLREVLRVAAVADGDGHIALISGAHVEPESWVYEGTARRVIADLLDAVAAGEYEIATGYLVNEGWSQEVGERLGDLWESSPEELFTGFCERAACRAPYEIGPTVSVNAWSRTMEVVFSTEAGLVTLPLSAVVFEGRVTVSNLPPDGRANDPAEPVDVRLFGAPYPGTLNLIRYQAVQRIIGGESAWFPLYRLPGSGRTAVVGDDVVVDEPAGGVTALPLDGGELGLVAAEPFRLAGSGIAGGRRLVFLTDGEQVDVVDLDSGNRAPLPGPFGGRPIGVDPAGGRLLVTVESGEAIWFETYEFDAAGLTLGALVGRVQGRTGVARLSPDGNLIATSLGNAVAVVDPSLGTVGGRWDLGGDSPVVDLEFDGRWIVVRLDDTTTVAIDVETGDQRRLSDLPVIRFG